MRTAPRLPNQLPTARIAPNVNCPYCQPQLGPGMPVIDINKLPRYGVLAPPIPREPKQVGFRVRV